VGLGKATKVKEPSLETSLEGVIKPEPAQVWAKGNIREQLQDNFYIGGRQA
jgi:hypothetical protein